MTDDEHSRFADKKLMLLQERLDSHIIEYEKHRREENERWDHLIVCQERNTKAIERLIDSTGGLIEVWQAATGTIKTFAALGRFMKWLSGFAVIGGILAWVAKYLPGA